MSKSTMKQLEHVVPKRTARDAGVNAQLRRWLRDTCEPTVSGYVAKSQWDSYMLGVATLLDITGRSSRRFYTCKDANADLRALASDWLAVEGDFQAAAKELARALLRDEREGQEALFDANQFTSR